MSTLDAWTDDVLRLRLVNDELTLELEQLLQPDHCCSDDWQKKTSPRSYLAHGNASAEVCASDNECVETLATAETFINAAVREFDACEVLGDNIFGEHAVDSKHKVFNNSFKSRGISMSNMTQDQRNQKKIVRAAKNRQAASRSRERKRALYESLENRIAEFEEKERAWEKERALYQTRIEDLRKQIVSSCTDGKV